MIRKAYEIFTEVTRDGAYANLALKKGLAGTDAREAGRVTALVYSATEHISYADFLIDHYKKGRLHGSIRNVLRLSVTELLFMDRPDHAVCSEGVELTRAIGKSALTGVVNGILRNIARDNAAGKLPPLPEEPAERLSVKYSVPRFMAEEYLKEYGPEFTEDLLSARLHNLTVRAQYPFTTAELEAALDALKIAHRRGSYDENALILPEGADVASMPLFREGKMTVQSESAMLVCRACRVQDGMRVLDTCAAPGGKTCCLSSLMRGTGSITALEVHPHRTELLAATARRLGVQNVRAITADAADPAKMVASTPCMPSQPATTTPPEPRVRSAPRATDSSWPRVPDASFSKNSSMPRHAVRKSMAKWWAKDSAAMPITSPPAILKVSVQSSSWRVHSKTQA